MVFFVQGKRTCCIERRVVLGLAVLLGGGCNVAVDVGPSVPFEANTEVAHDRIADGDRLTRRHDGKLRLEGCSGGDCPVIANELECLHIEVSGGRAGDVCGRCTVEVAGYTVSREICGATEGLPLRCGVDTQHFASDFTSCQQLAREDENKKNESGGAYTKRRLLSADTCLQHRVPDADASRAEPPASALAVAYEASFNALLELAAQKFGGTEHPTFSLGPSVLEQLTGLDDPKGRIFGACLLDAVGHSTEGIETIFARENLSRDMLESMVLQRGFYASNTPIEAWALLEAASRLGMRLPDLAREVNDVSPSLRPPVFSVSLLLSEVRDTERRRMLRDALLVAGRSFRETALPSSARGF